MQTPPYLKSGDKIAIVAPARKISMEELKPAANVLNSWGYECVFGDNLFKELNQYSGTDEERTSDFQKALDNDNIKAILCARGGYGVLRIIDKLDFTKFITNPKWIIGYSDVTVFHSHINKNFAIETLHATMPINFPKDGTLNQSLITLHKALKGDPLSYEIKKHGLNRKGVASGELCGGNLSILYALSASVSDIDTKGKILFIEDLDEYLYHIDRMILSLKRSGKLNNLAGLVVGGMSEMRDNTIPFGKTAEEIIAEAIAEYDYPVCFNFPAGHIQENYALIVGRKVHLSVGDTVVLNFDI